MPDMTTDEQWMHQALAQAYRAREAGEVPVGAVIVKEESLVGQGYNRPITDADPTAHAEIVALRDAAQKSGNYRLPGHILYATLEPCLMCAGAMIHARIQRLVYGAPDPRAGVIKSHLDAFGQTFLNHRITVTSGILAEQCAELLSSFFRDKRAGKR